MPSPSRWSQPRRQAMAAESRSPVLKRSRQSLGPSSKQVFAGAAAAVVVSLVSATGRAAPPDASPSAAPPDATSARTGAGRVHRGAPVRPGAPAEWKIRRGAKTADDLRERLLSRAGDRRLRRLDRRARASDTNPRVRCHGRRERGRRRQSVGRREAGGRLVPSPQGQPRPSPRAGRAAPVRAS